MIACKAWSERRMTAAIKTLADFWWSAYVEAGQPSLQTASGSKKKDDKLVQQSEVRQRCD